MLSSWKNRIQLAKIIAERFKEPTWRIFRLVNMVFDEIKRKIKENGRVEIRGFGVFKVKVRKGRTLTLPRSKKVIKVNDRKTIIFKPSKLLLKKLRENDSQT
jgi:nucleoid DNA-binding protein